MFLLCEMIASCVKWLQYGSQSKALNNFKRYTLQNNLKLCSRQVTLWTGVPEPLLNRRVNPSSQNITDCSTLQSSVAGLERYFWCVSLVWCVFPIPFILFLFITGSTFLESLFFFFPLFKAQARLTPPFTPAAGLNVARCKYKISRQVRNWAALEICLLCVLLCSAVSGFLQCRKSIFHERQAGGLVQRSIWNKDIRLASAARGLTEQLVDCAPQTSHYTFQSGWAGNVALFALQG